MALLDLGPHRGVHDRVDLDLPGQSFIGTATVSGSDDRAHSPPSELRGCSISATCAVPTWSFSPSDFRYLRLRVTGVTRIDGATVSDHHVANTARRVASSFAHGRFDLGGANVPVDCDPDCRSGCDLRPPRSGRGAQSGRCVAHGGSRTHLPPLRHSLAADRARGRRPLPACRRAQRRRSTAERVARHTRSRSHGGSSSRAVTASRCGCCTAGARVRLPITSSRACRATSWLLPTPDWDT